MLMLVLLMLSTSVVALWIPEQKYIPTQSRDHYLNMDRTGYLDAVQSGEIVERVSGKTMFADTPYTETQMRQDTEFQARNVLVPRSQTPRAEVVTGVRKGYIERVSKTRTGQQGYLKRERGGGRVPFRNVKGDFMVGDRVTYEVTQPQGTVGTAYAVNIKMIYRPGSTVFTR